MDLPQRDIRFTTTDDGVDIAFWEIGSGMPIVIANNWSLSHAELEWTVPSLASFYLDLAERYRVIRFDPRGIGLSGDPPGGAGATTPSGARQGMSTHEVGLDISAVARACGLDRFALMAVNIQGPVCIEYAAAHPDSVTALILCEAVAKVESSHMDPVLQGQMAIAQAQSDLGLELPVRMWERVVPGDERTEWTKLMQQTELRDPDEVGTLAQSEWNAELFLGQVAAPTLIISSRDRDAQIVLDGRRLAAGIPNSQLRIVDGLFAPYVADRAAVLDAIAALLGPGRKTSIGPVSDQTAEFAGAKKPVLEDGRILATLLFTDIVDSTSVQVAAAPSS